MEFKTLNEISKFTPRYKLAPGMSTAEYYKVIQSGSMLWIQSGLRNADGKTKSPFHYERYYQGAGKVKKAIADFNEFVKTVIETYYGYMPGDYLPKPKRIIKPKEFTIKIDFVEYAFLLEVCIPHTPIARFSVWQDAYKKSIPRMSLEECERLRHWMQSTNRYKRAKEDNIDGIYYFEEAIQKRIDELTLNTKDTNG